MKKERGNLYEKVHIYYIDIHYSNKCPYFWNAIEKYGWDNFSHEVVASGLTKEEACELEIRLVAENKTQDRNFGYNILEGGTAPSIPEEVRQKMSVSMMGNKSGLGHPCSEEKKKKITVISQLAQRAATLVRWTAIPNWVVKET